jgi:hypothetical protein
LDEIPFYLESARATSVGTSDLAKVTGTALTTLFNAIAEGELRNVCLGLKQANREPDRPWNGFLISFDLVRS